MMSAPRNVYEDSYPTQTKSIELKFTGEHLATLRLSINGIEKVALFLVEQKRQQQIITLTSIPVELIAYLRTLGMTACSMAELIESNMAGSTITVIPSLPVASISPLSFFPGATPVSALRPIEIIMDKQQEPFDPRPTFSSRVDHRG